MPELIFYTNPQSRGRIVRWMLEECAADYRTVVVPYGPEMKSEPFISLNPMGKVPVLVYAGKAVTETAAIVAFLADLFPAAKLAPPPEQRQDYYRWLFFAAGPLEAAATNKSLGFELPADKGAMAGYGSYDLVVETLAKKIARAPYVAGDHFTAADLYIASHLGFGMQFGTLPKLAEFSDYFERVSKRPARLRADELDNALMKPA
ncbi:MAG TPA: glutathione S-transferase family protein [Pseudomonadales bacterium]